MDKFSIILCVFIIVVLIAGVVTGLSFDYGNEQILEITVKDKYVKTYDEDGKYLVVDTNNNTYEIEDLLFKGKFNSTDLYNKIDIGETYKITTTGYRMQFFSMYQNINTLEKIEK